MANAANNSYPVTFEGITYAEARKWLIDHDYVVRLHFNGSIIWQGDFCKAVVKTVSGGKNFHEHTAVTITFCSPDREVKVGS